jgi:glycosyltransferase involved in cell wall biosynthesis
MGKKDKTKDKKKEKEKENSNAKFPFVSVCTPTFNRRPFIPFMIKCFQNQTYPKDRIEWIIIDDGTDKIEDLVSHIPSVKYFKYDNKLTLGKKRNISHEKSSGDILVYMDDDDYYPSERISHAVETLQKNPLALCAGSSEMYIYFKHISKMYKFGPYGPNHATAASFAFRKELLNQTSFEESACLAEEKHFLKNYTIPFVQLEPRKSILVFSHNHNSFDKKQLLNQGANNPYINETNLIPGDFIREKDLLMFFMVDIDDLLNKYEPGRPTNKPDVLKQLEEIKIQRENMMREQHKKQMEQTQLSHMMNKNNELYQKQINDMSVLIQELTLENGCLHDKVKYLENKIKLIVSERIEEKVKWKLASASSTV